MNIDTTVHFVQTLYKRRHMQHRSDLHSKQNEKNTHPEKLTLNYRHKRMMLSCLRLRRDE